MDRSWLALIMTLPTHNATARMRVWRALKALGCGVLRDGVYLLPSRPQFQTTLRAQADEITAGGGIAYVLTFNGDDPSQQQRFEGFFDRSDDYARLVEAVQQTTKDLPSENPAKLQRRVSRLRKDFSEIVSLDFFPSAAREQAASALEELEHDVVARVAPDEPHAVHGRLRRLERKEYQARVWATRHRPWIDRLASAWLIRRFIDPDAQFLWLPTPADCPPEALGFDFDGATFTHVGAKVTFEVLLASFGLTDDAALTRLGGVVHYLDVGGIPVPEAPGLEVLMQGMRRRLNDDDALLAEAEKAFDSFYLAFSGNDA